MRALLVCDKPGWAFDAIAQALSARAPEHDLELELFYLKGHEHELEAAVARSDIAFPLHWSLVAEVRPLWRDRLLRRRRTNSVPSAHQRFSFLDPRRTLTGIHAHHDWDERRTLPGQFVAPPEPLVRFLAQYRGVNTVSRRLARLFRDAGLHNVTCTENGVDTNEFRPTAPLGTNRRLRIGYAGTKRRDWKEGISEFIEPLAEHPWLDVRIATPEDGRYVPRDQMPAFYNDVDVYVCASRSEGLSLAVLEAAATGRPIVTTRVGGSEDLVREGVNGMFVERNRDSIVAALERLHEDRNLLREMGERSRAEIERAWSWEHRAGNWLRFIRSGGEPEGA